MNIVDMMTGLNVQNTENSFSNKIAKRSEEKDIERFADNIVDDVLRRVSDRFMFISKGLSYGEMRKISEEDSKELTNKLKEQIKEIPNKLKTEIEAVFGTSSNEEVKDKKEESSIETQQPAPAEEPAPVASISAFGY